MNAVNGTASAARFTYEDLLRVYRTMRDAADEQDRKVFLYKGSLADFRARLREAGVEAAAPGSPGILLTQRPYAGLEVHELNGYCITGTPEACRRFLGRLETKPLAPIPLDERQAERWPMNGFPCF